jgi:hypothetical protein
MMKIAITLAALAGSAVAFAPASSGSKATTALNAEMSKSMPFLTAPTKLDGYIGGVGFDPLGFSDNFDPKWLAESEIKHGRVAMLAASGFVVSQFVNFPMYADMHVDDSNMAPTVVGVSAMLQIVCAAGIEEWRTNKGKITMEDMFSDPARVPGELGFDPMGYLKKSEKEINDLKLKEIKNGRLAMLAIGGMIHHNFVTGEPLL